MPNGDRINHPTINLRVCVCARAPHKWHQQKKSIVPFSSLFFPHKHTIHEQKAAQNDHKLAAPGKSRRQNSTHSCSSVSEWAPIIIIVIIGGPIGSRDNISPSLTRRRRRLIAANNHKLAFIIINRSNSGTNIGLLTEEIGERGEAPPLSTVVEHQSKHNNAIRWVCVWESVCVIEFMSKKKHFIPEEKYELLSV